MDAYSSQLRLMCWAPWHNIMILQYSLKPTWENKIIDIRRMGFLILLLFQWHNVWCHHDHSSPVLTSYNSVKELYDILFNIRLNVRWITLTRQELTVVLFDPWYLQGKGFLYHAHMFPQAREWKIMLLSGRLYTNGSKARDSWLLLGRSLLFFKLLRFFCRWVGHHLIVQIVENDDSVFVIFQIVVCCWLFWGKQCEKIPGPLFFRALLHWKMRNLYEQVLT
jgi:hypothetical protein